MLFNCVLQICKIYVKIFKRKIYFFNVDQEMVPLPPPMPAHDSPYYDDQPNYPDRSSLNQDIQNHSFAKHFDPSYPYIKQYEAQSEISFDMNEELKSVIPRFKQKQNYGIPIPKTPMVFIDEKSTENEVQEWLQKKGFSKNVRERMKGLKGSEVMGFDRDELEEEFGKEGKRLASQITLQKEICKVSNGTIFHFKKIIIAFFSIRLVRIQSFKVNSRRHERKQMQV